MSLVALIKLKLNNKFNALEYRLASPRLNIWKTLYVNFRLFAIRDALKLPILVYGSLRIYQLGKIILNVPKIEKGIVRIGIFDIKSYGRTAINNCGTIVFNGRCDIWGGCYIELSNTASLNIGKHALIGENVRILLQGQCTIGKYLRLAYNSQIIDTDFHFLVNVESGEIKNCRSNVVIGDYNWIGNNTTIKKGAITPDYTIVAAPNAMLNKDYRNITSKYPILGGSPAKEISHGVRRIFSITNESLIRKHFENMDTPYFIDVATIDEFCTINSIP